MIEGCCGGRNFLDDIQTIAFQRKGSGNEAFPESNPQAELISAEENGVFQGFSDFEKPME